MMDVQLDNNRFQEYGHSEENSYDNSFNRYSPDKGDQRSDRERTRDRERRRERRRRKREHDRDRDYYSREEDGRDRSRDRHRSRDGSHIEGLMDRPREARGLSMENDEDGSMYDYGEGFYEEGGYIDHPTHAAQQQNDYSTSSHKYGRDSGRDRDRDRGGGDRWMTDTPTNTVLLRGLPASVDEKDIKAELMLFGAPVKDVRLMKRKDTGIDMIAKQICKRSNVFINAKLLGASRGFAFVEFQNLTDAQRWMDQNQGHVLLLNQYRVKMYYSTPRTSRPGDSGLGGDRQQSDWQRTEWTCSKCGYHNFRRRDHCFKCSTTREESDRAKEGDGFDQVGTNPCNTLIFRGLDALTTEENIITALSKLSAIPVKNAKVLRDELTGTSRGFGFAEFNTLAESSQMLELLQNLPTPFEVDGKAIIVSYAKNTFSTVMATMNSWSQTTQQTTDYNYTPYSQSTYYDSASGQYYDPTTGQYYDYSAYYAQQQAASGTVTQTDSTNAAAAVAQAAIQQAQAAKQYSKVDTTKHPVEAKPKVADHTKTVAEWPSASASADPSSIEYAKYPTPDVSTYQYDESSGYYYDPSTGLYYDANSQYYYNSTTNQFLYWDGETQTYLPAPNQEQSAAAVSEKKDEEKTKKDREKKDKVKVAKKIAKDMAKWAKTLNAQKEAMKEGFKRSMQLANQKAEKESASADAGFAILEKVKAERPATMDLFKKKEEKQLMPPPALSGGGKPGLVASYGGDSDEDDEDDHSHGGNIEEKLLDWNKLACLLCKRQFPSKEALQRHQQLSDLHKKNLESLKKSRADEASSVQAYRDRAKERREKYGRPEPPVPKKSLDVSAPVPFEQPTRHGLKEDNVGNKLLQKMGWSQGQGLGKANQGRTEVVETTFRQAQAGLGTRGSSYNVNPGDSYKETVKKMMHVRYHESD